jgi:mRNA interferase MazF
MVDLDPVVGHEQGRRRPALVVSHDVFNAGPADMVIVLPLTSRPKPGIPTCVPVEPNSRNGLSQPSTVLCDQIRPISKSRLKRRMGALDQDALQRVGFAIQALLWF